MNKDFQKAAISGQMAVVTPMSAGQAEAMIRASFMLRSLVGELRCVGDAADGVGERVVSAARRGLVFAAELAAEALGPDEERFMGVLGLDGSHLEASTHSTGAAQVNAAALLGYLQAVLPGVNEVGDVEALRDRGEGRLCVTRREIESVETEALTAAPPPSTGETSPSSGSFLAAAGGPGSGGYL